MPSYLINQGTLSAQGPLTSNAEVAEALESMDEEEQEATLVIEIGESGSAEVENGVTWLDANGDNTDED